MPIGRIGQDFPVNTTTDELQNPSSATALADGRFVAVWQSFDLGESSPSCVRARIYRSDGSAAGTDFIVNTTADGEQTLPRIAALADGRFVVSWWSRDTGDGSGSCVRGRIYEADGTPVGADFIVNSTTSNDRFDTSITALAEGGFVVTWESADLGDGSGRCIRARIYGADGNPTGSDFIVNTTVVDTQRAPSITTLAEGGFVVTWGSSDPGDNSDTCIRARVYGANGIPIGGDFVVNTTPTDIQRVPSVTALVDGGFVVAWESSDTGDGFGACIRARIYGPAGIASGGDFIVNTTATANQTDPSVAALADGRFVLAWMSRDTGDGIGACIRARVYGLDGTPAGEDFIVNTIADDDQFAPSIAAFDDGRFVVTWSSGDGSNSGIRAQMFDPTVFIGTIGQDAWKGGNFADTINGGASSDTLAGLAGDDVIGGDSGNDALNGGDGNDRLSGGADNDTLTGCAGTDTMYGGQGNDQFSVDNFGDVAYEAPGQGADSVFAAVSHALRAGQEIELLATASQGGTTAINLTGNNYSQRINGNNGNNALYGGAGNDLLVGYAGNDNLEGQAGFDTLKGVSGSDKFVFRQATVATAGADHIADFGADDFIYFDHPGAAGLLNPAAFAVGANALDADDRFIYYAPYNALYFDPDGSGATAKALFAVFDNGYVPAAADIVLF